MRVSLPPGERAAARLLDETRNGALQFQSALGPLEQAAAAPGHEIQSSASAAIHWRQVTVTLIVATKNRGTRRSPAGRPSSSVRAAPGCRRRQHHYGTAVNAQAARVRLVARIAAQREPNALPLRH